jgi:hypothetical protein
MRFSDPLRRQDGGSLPLPVVKTAMRLDLEAWRGACNGRRHESLVIGGSRRSP